MRKYGRKGSVHSKKMTFFSKIRSLNERAVDVLWATLAAAVLTFLSLQDPIDQAIWITQSKEAKQPMSGDIVFATSKKSLSDPDDVTQRYKLAAALRALENSEVEQVYLDFVLDPSRSPSADHALADAIAGMGDRITVSWKVSNYEAGRFVGQHSDKRIVGTARHAPNFFTYTYWGFAWSMPASADLASVRERTLPQLIAGKAAQSNSAVPINYQFDIATLPEISADAELATTDLVKLRGKSVVFGNPPVNTQETVSIPGAAVAPASYVTIFAAETLKAGQTTEVSGWLVLLAATTAMLLISLVGGRRNRSVILAYLAITLSLPVLVGVSAVEHVRVGFGATVLMLAWYAALRLRARWQKRFALEDDKTGLPTFRAFEKELAKDSSSPSIVVAKVNGYEDVVKTLPADLHAEYVRSLVERFRVADKSLAIFANEGRYFAWTSRETNRDDLEAHLDGLRALFSAPIIAGSFEVDAGITFGVDMSSVIDPVQRIASAVSAAEATDEAHNPISFAIIGEKSDALWKLSLQARIDNALQNREIYLVYQPKVDIETGQMIGVEALVRWDDPARGQISPAYFVQECERAGRMDHLTRYVLKEAATAALVLESKGIGAKMSVNISATLLRDERVEHMVSDVLFETGIKADQLMLEITETARIVDIPHAVRVLERLRELGIKISIDDFGVGSANLETLYRLPFDELKIDRVFISDLGNAKAAAIVDSLIAFGSALRISVVAEGAEDEATLEFLRRKGCRIVQGYGISPPLKFDKLVMFQLDRAKALP